MTELPPPGPWLPRFYTIDEVAPILRRTPKAVRQLRARGLGPPFRKIAGRLLIEEHDLLDWIRQEAS
jgi:DNA-binding transcriptional MerR regulator